jgi:hypothetical protein
MKLFIKINKKIATKIVELPMNDVGPKRVLNSPCSLFITIFIEIENFLGITQNDGIRMIINKIDLIQFIE